MIPPTWDPSPVMTAAPPAMSGGHAPPTALNSVPTTSLSTKKVKGAASKHLNMAGAEIAPTTENSSAPTVLPSLAVPSVARDE